MTFPCLALLTDFGVTDPYVGVMKAVFTSMIPTPTVPILDLCHGIRPHAIEQGAWVLESALDYLPPQTVTVAVVDPNVGSPQQGKRLVYWPERQQGFIGPDNGLLTPVLAAAGPLAKVYDINQPRLFRQPLWSQEDAPVSQTFHGRDCYVPVAAHLIKALLSQDHETFLTQLGTDNAPIHRLIWAAPTQTDQGTTGQIRTIDQYGNLVTNIPASWLFHTALSRPMPLQLALGGHRHPATLVDSYQAGSQSGTTLFVVAGSHGRLEIASYCQPAADLLPSKIGDSIDIQPLSSPDAPYK
jgi:S-adenosylmethionine hydrolase